MNDIDRILSNIDNDDDEAPLPAPEPSGGDDDIESLVDRPQDEPAVPSDGPAATATPAETEPHDEYLPDPVLFTPRGTKPWNRREPYLIRINDAQLADDREHLLKSFFFVDAPADQNDIKQKIRQEIVAFLRRPNDHATERYREFINRTISDIVTSVSEGFSISENNRPLFTYHTGPLTIYKIIRQKYLSERYGYCYRYIPGNKATRFFPEEFIKAAVLQWFGENIQILDLPFDSIQRYEEVKDSVSQKYQSDLKIFNLRLEQLNAKAGHDRSISRARLFQAKGAEWFGHPAIEVYRRYLGGQIFM